jgi:hypothetical protein
VLTKHNVPDATDEYKNLVNDSKIDLKKDKSKKKYFSRIKAKSKKPLPNIGACCTWGRIL